MAAAIHNIARISTRTSEVSVTLPPHIDEALFTSGFEHGLRSNTLTNFKASYRAGFREAKRVLREQRRQQGIIEVPSKYHFKLKL